MGVGCEYRGGMMPMPTEEEPEMRSSEATVAACEIPEGVGGCVSKGVA